MSTETISTIKTFKGGRINTRGTIFTTLATVAHHDEGYSLFFVSDEDVHRALNQQGYIIAQSDVRACVRDMKRLNQLHEYDRGRYIWNIDPRPFAVKTQVD